MVFFTTMFTTADVNIHALIAKYGIDIQIVRRSRRDFLRSLTEFLTPAFINNKT
jgi:hypothetical protein